jgi:hypothetical protein
MVFCTIFNNKKRNYFMHNLAYHLEAQQKPLKDALAELIRIPSVCLDEDQQPPIESLLQSPLVDLSK